MNPSAIAPRAGVPLVLASRSPRRRAVLEQLGLRFDVVRPPEGVERPWRETEAPDAYAHELASAKARAVASGHPTELVLAADTIVVLDGHVLGKPQGPAEARAMLGRLAGREHVVHTGLSVVAPGGAEASGVEATGVVVRPLSKDEIEAYVATGEPLDKAGAYGIQGMGAAMVEAVRGCYFNVMGLPVARLLALLRELGYAYRWPGSIVRR